MQKLSTVIPKDNEATVQLLRPVYTIIPEILAGLKVIHDPTNINVTVEDNDGVKKVVAIQPIPHSEYLEKIKRLPMSLPHFSKTTNPDRADQYFYFEVLKEFNSIYIQYNRTLAKVQSGEN